LSLNIFSSEANVIKQKTNEGIAIAGRVSFCERTSGNELQESKPARAFFAIFLSRGKKVDEIKASSHEVVFVLIFRIQLVAFAKKELFSYFCMYGNA
jgi:hypothetical protein